MTVCGRHVVPGLRANLQCLLSRVDQQESSVASGAPRSSDFMKTVCCYSVVFHVPA